MPIPPRTDPLAVRKHLEEQVGNLSRDPFKQVLAHFIAAEPTIEAIAEFAEANPDKWAKSLSELAKSAGYLDKRVEEHNFNFNFVNKSDAELYADLQNIMPGVDLRTIIQGEYNVESERPCDSEVLGASEGIGPEPDQKRITAQQAHTIDALQPKPEPVPIHCERV